MFAEPKHSALMINNVDGGSSPSTKSSGLGLFE